jgi:nucleoside-diphosphate-sugar epimerase
MGATRIDDLHAQRVWEKGPSSEEELEELLSRPTQGVIHTISKLSGDIIVLGVGGKMGSTLARMARRALDALGRKERVIGVARFTDAKVEQSLQVAGIETVRCDLRDRKAVKELPDAPNVIFMAGQKFGTTDAPERTWMMNVIVPEIAAERYIGSRTVVFSTGCVYAETPVAYGGSLESDPLEPLGEYANSCVGRERVFTYYAKEHSTPVALFRLYYAIDMRYGVLYDVARKVADGIPIDVTLGHVNVVWQGDANAWAIQCLEHAASPPFVVNATGPEIISIRTLAKRFGELFGREPVIVGEEAPTAFLGNARKAHALFGYPTVPLDRMTQWVAQWIQQGGRSLEKPTHFETRDGRY